MKFHLKITSYISMIFMLLLSVMSWAQPAVPEKPNPPVLVNDFAGFMSGQQVYQLEQKLRKYNDSTGTQIVIVTVNSLNGESPVNFATEIGHKWQVGGAKYDNGIVILLARKEKKSFIATGYGMEPILTSGICKRLTDYVMKPQFKQGHFYEGLNETVDYIKGIASGKFKPDQIGKKSKTSGFLIIIIFFVVVFIIIIFLQRIKSVQSNHYGSHAGPDLFTSLFLLDLFSGSHRRGGGYDDFSSGGGDFSGFDGFGGGDFGGGGAGGDW